MDLFWIILIVIIIFVTCAMCKTGERKPMFSAPVVVTTATVPVPPMNVAHPIPGTVIQGYPMPQPQPGYPPQPGMYSNQPIGAYPMPQPQVDHNPPSYDQVVHGSEAYQKQAPYNPNYAGP